jgi:hypothetical protein
MGDGPDLVVPDLRGSAVPATEEVECVRCGKKVPIASADIVGLGYRCTPCTTKASIGELTGKHDDADHLSIGDREHLARQGRNLALVSFGGFGLTCALVAVLGVPVVLAKYSGVLLLSGIVGAERWHRFHSRTPGLAPARLKKREP